MIKNLDNQRYCWWWLVEDFGDKKFENNEDFDENIDYDDDDSIIIRRSEQ